MYELKTGMSKKTGMPNKNKQKKTHCFIFEIFNYRQMCNVSFD